MTEQSEVVGPKEWLKARRELLVAEKEVTKRLDQLAARRRRLPHLRIDTDYIFDTGQGTKSLGDLFGGRSQLIVYHFMMGPDWEEGCPSCSFWADSFNGIGPHLEARDTTMIAVSRAPLDAITAYKERLGWDFTWVSSLRSEFNADFGVSFPVHRRDGASYNFSAIEDPPEEAPGLSVFLRDSRGDVFQTYSTFGRGIEIFNAAYQLLDLTPKGRDEDDLDFTMAWLRRNDSYDV